MESKYGTNEPPYKTETDSRTQRAHLRLPRGWGKEEGQTGRRVARASLVAQMVKNQPAMQETWVRSLGWEFPWRRESLPTPVFCPGEFHGLYIVYEVAESRTGLNDFHTKKDFLHASNN